MIPLKCTFFLLIQKKSILDLKLLCLKYVGWIFKKLNNQCKLKRLVMNSTPFCPLREMAISVPKAPVRDHDPFFWFLTRDSRPLTLESWALTLDSCPLTPRQAVPGCSSGDSANRFSEAGKYYIVGSTSCTSRQTGARCGGEFGSGDVRRGGNIRRGDLGGKTWGLWGDTLRRLE